MNKTLIVGAVGIVWIIGMVFLLLGSKAEAPLIEEAPHATTTVATTTEEEVWECNGDAQICPDGSSVGRTGPNCEFVVCPSEDVASDRVSTYLGGRVTRFNLTLNPVKIISDSRCPEGVQCIWAGTVEVRTVVSTITGHGEHVFTLGEAKEVGDFMVTLVEVTPHPVPDQNIQEHSYRFTYLIEKR
jgi:hypothetical protein